MQWRPKLVMTMGDVAGIGPEVIVRACLDERLLECCRPIVIGNPKVLERACDLIDSPQNVREVASLDDWQPEGDHIACWNPTDDTAGSVSPSVENPHAGRAAYDYLIAATDAALVGKIDAITTAPLNKAALRMAGLNYPGHTEILAERCGVNRFAMMLYLPEGETIRSPNGLGVAHVTLHCSIESVPRSLSSSSIAEKIELIDHFMKDVGLSRPRIGVCALNPHAGEGGLFGNEEQETIRPAVVAARELGIEVAGPFPADTLLHRAVSGEFDGVVAMYHDQGHIALKLIGFKEAVNVTLGLPIIRTSPSHGTAFDIAWQGKADASGMLEAIRIAVVLARRKRMNKLAL